MARKARKTGTACAGETTWARAERDDIGKRYHEQRIQNTELRTQNAARDPELRLPGSGF
jgi:hypothetical protein